MTGIDRARAGAWKFKFQPIIWLTTVGAIGGALLEADRQAHILPTGAGHWIAFVVVTVALIGTGLKAHQVATPLADPRSEQGTPLVPVTTVPHLRPSPEAGGSGR